MSDRIVRRIVRQMERLGGMFKGQMISREDFKMINEAWDDVRACYIPCLDHSLPRIEEYVSERGSKVEKVLEEYPEESVYNPYSLTEDFFFDSRTCRGSKVEKLPEAPWWEESDISTDMTLEEVMEEYLDFMDEQERAKVGPSDEERYDDAMKNIS